MVVGAFPVFKLGALLAKQISKPIAAIIARKAKEHPVFSRVVCMPPAQLYNWCEVRIKMWAMNLGKPVNIPKLNEAMAIELGASLLSEIIIFVIGALLIVAEVARQSRKEAKKEKSRRRELNDIHLSIQDMYYYSKNHEIQIKEILRILSELDSKVGKASLQGKPEPLDKTLPTKPQPLPNTKPATDTGKGVNSINEKKIE